MSFEDLSAQIKKVVAETSAWLSWPVALQSKLYGLYKQATEGDADYKQQPYVWNLFDRKKWDAWNSYRGQSSQEARQQYVKLASAVLEMLQTQGVQGLGQIPL
jgi:acyl-CoA-binding protein